MRQWLEFVREAQVCNRSFEQHRAINAFASAISDGGAQHRVSTKGSAGLTFPDFVGTLPAGLK